MSHIYRQGQQCGDLQREWGGGQRGSAGGGGREDQWGLEETWLWVVSAPCTLQTMFC